MRNRVFWNSPHTRILACLSLLGVMALALAGCGGGGGGGGPVVTPTTVSVSGTVKDTAGNPVVGALVSIVGTTLSTRTDAGGHYSFASVPVTATAFKVTNPDTSAYFSYANFNTKLYDIIACTFPLPTSLHTGTNTVSEVDLYVGGSSPPPPPPTGGCP